MHNKVSFLYTKDKAYFALILLGLITVGILLNILFIHYKLGLLAILCISLLEILFVIYLLQAATNHFINFLVGAILLASILALAYFANLTFTENTNHTIQELPEPINRIFILFWLAPLASGAVYLEELALTSKKNPFTPKTKTMAIIIITVCMLSCIIVALTIHFTT